MTLRYFCCALSLLVVFKSALGSVAEPDSLPRLIVNTAITPLFILAENGAADIGAEMRIIPNASINARIGRYYKSPFVQSTSSRVGGYFTNGHFKVYMNDSSRFYTGIGYGYSYFHNQSLATFPMVNARSYQKSISLSNYVHAGSFYFGYNLKLGRTRFFLDGYTGVSLIREDVHFSNVNEFEETMIKRNHVPEYLGYYSLEEETRANWFVGLRFGYALVE
ncbi:MAG: hypothetical protein JJ975_07140 [Bacteroidia bacterium]|nr:hypothetical protein [Bacteroidia bacterium]